MRLQRYAQTMIAAVCKSRNRALRNIDRRAKSACDAVPSARAFSASPFRPSPAASNEYPLNLVEAHFVAAAVVKLRRARRGMVRHGSGLFERPAILEIGSNAGRAEAVIADFRGDAGGQ